MNCPKCASEVLVQSPCLGEIPLDHCVNCDGIWFDKDELEALLKKSQGEVPSDMSLINPKADGLVCPRCNNKMSRGGLVNPLLLVDQCPACGGTWLDSNELALLKRLLGLTGGETKATGLVRPPAPAPAPLPVVSRIKFVPLLCALAGLIGLSAMLYHYVSPIDQKPFEISAVKTYAVIIISFLLLGGGLFAMGRKGGEE